MNTVIYVVSRMDTDIELDLVAQGQHSILGLGQRIVLCGLEDRFSNRSGCLVTSKRAPCEVIKKWIRNCEHGHKMTCGKLYDRPRLRQQACKNIRLIDVMQESVVQLPWTARYLTLSYVWGRPSQQLLDTSNVSRLAETGGITKYLTLPKTFRDAIMLTILLDEKYLWIDSLCLMQSSEEFQMGVDSMDFIYEFAHATIVAANGPDADSGLPGVQEDRQLAVQNVATIKDGLELMFYSALPRRLDPSVWASRGWTFQEELFSRRLVVFVDGMVYMRCREHVCSEDRPRDALPVPVELETNVLTYYQAFFDDMSLDAEENMFYMVEAIRKFQERQLTKPESALNAVAGITERLSHRMNTSMLEGLPSKFLDLALLFAYDHTNRLRSGTNTRIPCFPSRTWAGMSGNSYWPWAHPRELEPSAKNFLTSSTWIRWFQWTNGRLGKASAIHASNAARREKLLTRFTMLNTAVWKPSLPPALPSHDLALPYSLLVFYTVTITLQAIVDSTPNSYSLQLLDKGGRNCGKIMLDVLEVLETTLVWLKHQLLGRRVTVILLSDAHRDSQSLNSRDDPCYWALLVAWTGSFYERRGIGKVNHSCVTGSCDPGPQWKEIILG